MNFKTTLLASAAALFVTSANAADITGAFYLPTEGHFLSTTTIETHQNKTDDGHASAYEAAEKLVYGLTDDWSVYGTLSNTFMHDANLAYDYDADLNNDHNFGYTLGTAYNMNYGRWLVQLGAAYITLDPRSWVGKGLESNRWVKELNANVKVGYEAGCGFTPYTTFDVYGNIDDNDRDIAYSWFVGAHKQVDRVAVDAGVRYDFSTDKGNEREEAWTAEASVDYYLKDNMTVGVYGDYYLGGRDRHDIDYKATLGLALRVAF